MFKRFGAIIAMAGLLGACAGPTRYYPKDGDFVISGPTRPLVWIAQDTKEVRHAPDIKAQEVMRQLIAGFVRVNEEKNALSARLEETSKACPATKEKKK